MKFRHLHYFLVLAEELHFGRAAERLAISQPPLSWNIQQLEEILDAQLFDRGRRGVQLTRAGQALVPRARALMAQAEDAAQLVRDTARGLRGTLKIGVVGSVAYQGLPALLQAFEAALPDVRCRTVELNSSEQVVAVTSGQLDLGFVHTANLPEALSRLQYAVEPFVCCLPAAHPAAGRQRLAVTELRHQSFVMFARDASPDYYERVLVVCTEAGFTPDIRHEARHWLSVVSLVAQGLGVALVPAALQTAGMAGAAFVPLRNATAQSRTYCIWHRDNSNPALLALLRHVKARSHAAHPAD